MKRYLVAGLVGTLAIGGTAAFAAIPGSDGVISGCVKKDGELRVIDLADPKEKERECKKDELALSWNQTGPRGPQGPQGAQGPAGPAGLTLFANVRADGTLANGGAVVSSAKLTPGVFGSGYVVTFNRSVSTCAAVASAGQTGVGVAQSDAIASSNVDTIASDKVFIAFKSAAGSFVDTDFHLILACP